MRNLFTSLISIIILLIDIYIFRNTQEIQKPGYACQCGNTYQIKRISQTILTIIGLTLLLFISLFIIKILMSKQLYQSIKILSILIMFISLFNIGLQAYYLYLMITYVYDLDNHGCTCVDSNFVSIVKYYSWTRLLIAIFSIISVIIILSVMSRTKPNKI
jgi:hypothetical protein